MKNGIERRKEHRLSFQGNIPGRLRHESKDLNFAPFDISRKGLGLYLNPCPSEGEELSLYLAGSNKPALTFTIKHIYGQKGDFMRCGIELKGNSEEVDLIEVLTRYF